MTRLILIPMALLLVLVGAALLLPLLVDEHELLAKAADALHEQTGATLTVEGDTHLSLFPVAGVTLTKVALTLPQTPEADLRAHSLEVGVRLLPLLSGKIEVDTINLDGVTLRIDATQQPGAASVQLDDVAAGAGTALAVPAALQVKQLLVTNSRLEWVDASSTTVVELVSLEATDLNLLQRPISLALQLRRPGEHPVELRVDGALRLNQTTQQITLDSVTAVLSGASLAPVTLQSSGSIDLTRESANLAIELQQGAVHGQGELNYASSASPRMTAQLRLNQFDPALFALAGPEAAAAVNDSHLSAAAPEPLPLEALRLVDTHAILDIDQAQLGAHTVNHLHLDLRGSGGVVEVTALQGELHGGTLDATATLDATGDTAALTTNGSVKQLDIASLVAEANTKPSLAGHATVNWQLAGSGRTRDELTTALQGSVNLSTEKVVLQGISVEHLLCQTVALTNNEALTAEFSPDTHFETVSATGQIANGAANLTSLTARLPGVALSGNGRIDLLTQDFTAKLNGHLSDSLEKMDHACRLSKSLVAIAWPVDCAGNVATEPAKWCRLDTTKILQDLTVNKGQDKLGKKAGKLLDKLFHRKD